MLYWLGSSQHRCWRDEHRNHKFSTNLKKNHKKWSVLTAFTPQSSALDAWEESPATFRGRFDYLGRIGWCRKRLGGGQSGGFLVRMEAQTFFLTLTAQGNWQKGAEEYMLIGINFIWRQTGRRRGRS